MISLDGLSSCRCSTTSHGDLKKMCKNANQSLKSFRFMQIDFHQEDGHSSDLDQKKKWYSTLDRVSEQRMINFVKADAQFSVSRVHCPEERSKAKVVENSQNTSALMKKRLKLFFRRIISVNQSSIYGAVSDLC